MCIYYVFNHLELQFQVNLGISEKPDLNELHVTGGLMRMKNYGDKGVTLLVVLLQWLSR